MSAGQGRFLVLRLASPGTLAQVIILGWLVSLVSVFPSLQYFGPCERLARLLIMLRTEREPSGQGSTKDEWRQLSGDDAEPLDQGYPVDPKWWPRFKEESAT